MRRNRAQPVKRRSLLQPNDGITGPVHERWSVPDDGIDPQVPSPRTVTRHTKIGRAISKRRCQTVFVKLPKVTVRLPAPTGSPCRERGAKLQLVRIREQGKRLFGKAVGIVGTAVMKQAPHSFQKPGRCPRRQANDPEAIARRRPDCHLLALLS